MLDPHTSHLAPRTSPRACARALACAYARVRACAPVFLADTARARARAHPQEFNARTAELKPDVPVRVKLSVYTDKSFDIALRTPPTSYFLKVSIVGEAR